MSLDSNSNMGQAADRPSKKPIGDTEDKWDTKSVTKTYYRMTVREAREYVEDLRANDSKVPLEKLRDDEIRILRNRARLHKTMSTNKLQEELKRSFKEWCDEVNAKIKGKNIGPFLAGRESLVKPNVCPELADKVWEVGDNEDPAHEINAYFMFFEKGDQEYKGKKYQGQGFPDYESFPDQRITVHEALYSDTHNPFLPILDDNGKPYLRYIHLPANHMGVSHHIFASVCLTTAKRLFTSPSG